MLLLRTVTKNLAIKVVFSLVGLICVAGVHAEEKERENSLPVYIELQPAFVVNYIGYSEKLKYLKTGITLRATDVAADKLIEDNMPLIRDAMVMYLSSLNVEQVTGAEAREESRQNAITMLNNVLRKEVGKDLITDVLFTSFVTQ